MHKPFFAIATTIRIAHRLNRKAIGVDIHQGYVDLVREDLSAALTQPFPPGLSIQTASAA